MSGGGKKISSKLKIYPPPHQKSNGPSLRRGFCFSIYSAFFSNANVAPPFQVISPTALAISSWWTALNLRSSFALAIAKLLINFANHPAMLKIENGVQDQIRIGKNIENCVTDSLVLKTFRETMYHIFFVEFEIVKCQERISSKKLVI